MRCINVIAVRVSGFSVGITEVSLMSIHKFFLLYIFTVIFVTISVAIMKYEV